MKQANSWKKKVIKEDALYDQRKKDLKRSQEREDREKEVALQVKLKAKEDALRLQRELGMMGEDEEEEEEGDDSPKKGKLYYESLFADNVMCVTYKGVPVFKNPERMEVYYKRKMTCEEVDRNRNLRRELREKCLYGNYRLDENDDDQRGSKRNDIENEKGVEKENLEGDEKEEEDDVVVNMANASYSSTVDIDDEHTSIFKLEKLVVTEPLSHSIREATLEDYEEMKYYSVI